MKDKIIMIFLNLSLIIILQKNCTYYLQISEKFITKFFTESIYHYSTFSYTLFEN